MPQYVYNYIHHTHFYSWSAPLFTYVLYLSILKLGLYTCRGSNIHWVVQLNEWNKYLGPFKHWVPKLLNLIDVNVVPYVEENKLIFNILLDMFILLLDITTVVCLQHICNVYCLHVQTSYSVSEDHTHLWTRWSLTTCTTKHTQHGGT